jgi:5-methylcytosine-specific restriction protein A
VARIDWTREELILALDVYFRYPAARGTSSHPAIVELSRILNELPIHGRENRNVEFRNANGVSMKLSNFLRFDPSYKGKGLQRGNALEAVVWREFAHELPRLRRIAEAIKSNIHARELEEPPTDGDEEIEAPEGALLTRIHRARERNHRLVRKKKAVAFKANRGLPCEVCGFEFTSIYGELGLGFAECHHTMPVSQLRPGQPTRLRDLAVVCSNCHRMIHRRQPWLTLAELKTLLASPRA